MKKSYQTGENTKQNILQVSKELFYEKGFEDTVYDDICKKAKVNRALIPYYFKNKSDLALAVYNDLMVSFVETRDFLGKGYNELEKMILNNCYYYKLLEDPKMARFIRYVSGVNVYHDRMLLGEQLWMERMTVDGHKIAKRKLSALVPLYLGMEKEIIFMYEEQKYKEAEYATRVAMHMLFQYLGIEEKEIERVLTKVKRMLNRYIVKLQPDFTIVIEKKETKINHS